MPKSQKYSKKTFSSLLVICLLAFIAYKLIAVILPNYVSFVSPYYTEHYYKYLENLFNVSQYRVKNAPALIPDETVFSYAGGAYIRGMDPIFVNSEITPLGKYIIGLSILVLKNDKFTVVPFSILTLVVIWLLGKLVFANNILALIPVAVFVSEKLFLGQLITTPLLDIIQLPFILLSLYFFIRESSGNYYWLTALSLGFVAATKSVIMAFLLVATFLLYFIIKKQWSKGVGFATFLPLTAMILVASYVKTFLDGYTAIQFIGFQKWIILYQKSKLMFPFSVWRLIFLNQWQAWWGDMSILKAEDWQITWPIFSGLTILLITLLVFRKLKATKEVVLLCMWFFVYGVFLSIGVVSSRFLLPLLPVAFILGTYLLHRVYVMGRKRYKFI